MLSPLVVLSLLVAARVLHAFEPHVHEAQLHVQFAHSHQEPPPSKIASKGRKGDSSTTETVFLDEQNCFQTFKWDHDGVGVDLVGTFVNVTMDNPGDLLPEITIDPLSVVKVSRGVPCYNSGVAHITWEVDYMIPHTHNPWTLRDQRPVPVGRRQAFTQTTHARGFSKATTHWRGFSKATTHWRGFSKATTPLPYQPPVAVARPIGIIWA